MKILLSWVILFMAGMGFSQSLDPEADKEKRGAELKAMLIGGGATFGAVTGLGVLYTTALGSDGSIDAVMIPGTGVALAIPASLVSAGLGYLFGKHHAAITDGFVVGLGYSASSIDRRVHPAQEAKDWYNGLEIRLGTPRIGPIRYTVAYTRYETYEYITFNDPARSTYWEFNMNMQYVFDGEVVDIYPFLGSNLFYQNNIGTYYYDGGRYNETYSDLGFNMGVGMSVGLGDHWSIYAEPRFVVHDDDSQWVLSFGIQYSF